MKWSTVSGTVVKVLFRLDMGKRLIEAFIRVFYLTNENIRGDILTVEFPWLIPIVAAFGTKDL